MGERIGKSFKSGVKDRRKDRWRERTCMNCDEVMRTWDEVNQEESEQDEVDGTKKGADSTGEVTN